MTTQSAARTASIAPLHCAFRDHRGYAGAECTDRGIRPARPSSEASRSHPAQAIRECRQYPACEVPCALYGVGRAQHQAPGALQRPSARVQRVEYPVDHITRHVGVDIRGQLDETGVVLEGFHLPREIERVNRDAVPPQPRPRRELHEAKGLGGGGLDHLPHVHAHPLAHASPERQSKGSPAR